MNQTFRIRPYSKRELALLYFPDAPNPAAAVANLRAWIVRCDELKRQLRECGFSPHCIRLTPRQVKLIVEYLGEP